MTQASLVLTLILTCIATIAPAEPTRILSPYKGPSVKGVDTSTLTGKVMCGYQGWFTAPSDGTDLNWRHWARNARKPFGPDNVSVDLWPDMREFHDDERHDTGFRTPDGSRAEVFSSNNKKTVLRHFEWMQIYGIDGAFVQRFGVSLKSESLRNFRDNVLMHAREGANRSGRAYAVMYDLSGLQPDEFEDLVVRDWARVSNHMKITQDPAYLHHEGKPLVAVWGVGFKDRTTYSLKECRRVVTWLKNQGCAVMLGVPSWWREGTRDSIRDPARLKLLAEADVLSPWTVGRYRTPDEAARHAESIWQPDVTWCKERNIDLLPVVYPGFSWRNMKGDEGSNIPRLKGKFFWSQLTAAKRAGCEMIYVAMFDEMDEGTAIFKCTNHPPTGEGFVFQDLEGLPTDYYLRLTGAGGKLLRGEIPISDALPELD